MTRHDINKLTKKELSKAKHSKNPLVAHMAEIEWACRYENNAVGRLVLGGCTGNYEH